jgi:predicted nucleic acid-binding protein
MTTPPIVIDSSAAIAMIRDEREGVDVARIMRSAVLAGTRVMAPSHFWLEVMNPLMTRYRVSAADVIRSIHDLDRFRIETIEIDRPLLLATLDLSERLGLTPYDATYLAVAIAVDGVLLTLDADLAAAAGSRLITPGRHGLSERSARYEHDVTWPNYKEASAYLAHLRAETLAGRG